MNFAYQISNTKSLVANLKNWKLTNKMFYYKKLSEVDFEDKNLFFMLDSKFNFYGKTFIFDKEEKITLNDIEKLLNEFKKRNEKVIWYTINNIVVNWKKEKFILWQKWEISFHLWVYSLKNIHYDEVLEIFWKNKKVQIYPTSLFSINCLNNIFNDWIIVYLLENTTKVIKIVNWFYQSIEKIEIWLKNFNIWLLENFHKNINFKELGEYQKKVYLKELENFLQPISLFIKDNAINQNIYLVWDTHKYPKLTEKISQQINSTIIPLRIDNKSFKRIEDLDLYCIKKNNVKIW